MALHSAREGHTGTNECYQVSKSPIYSYNHLTVPVCSGCSGRIVTQKQYAEDRPGQALAREGKNCQGTNNFTFSITTRTRHFRYEGASYAYTDEWSAPTSGSETGTKWSGDQCDPDGEFVPDGWFDHLL